MKQFKVYVVIILLAVLIVPSVALAAWWNPFSWNIWSYFFQRQTTVKTNNVSVPIVNSLSDAQIADAIFPSSQWTEFQSQIPGSKSINAYKTKGQKGNLPLLWIDSTKRGDADKDGREDALIRVSFCGADCATEIKFVHNVSPEPVSLNFPTEVGTLVASYKTNVKDFGFTDAGFYAIYSDIADNQQRIDYKIVNGEIVESAIGQVTATSISGTPTPTPTNQITVAGMQEYTDTDFGFSFWYPASWKLQQTDVRSYIPLSGGTVKKIIGVGTTDSNGYMGGVGIQEFVSSDKSITDNSDAGPAGNGSKYLKYYFDSSAHTWMAETTDMSNVKSTFTANVSKNTMGGLHMLGGNARFADDVIIPLSASHFLVVYALDAGGTREDLLANTVVATDPTVATPISSDEQIKTIHAEGLLYGALGTSIPSWGYVDNQYVYDSQGNIVVGANPTTFKSIDVYLDGFKSPTGFATDGVHVYSEARSAKAELVPQADPATFVAIRAPYQIPYAQTSGKYGQSFTSYDMTYEKDKSHVYDKGRLIPNADPNTFVVIGQAEMYANPNAQNFTFAKDAYHNYGEDSKGNVTIDGITVK
jgi:hypothetical protein